MHNACLAGVAEMMGRQAGGQERLFYSFNLESVVPENHLLCGINRCLDLRELREHLADYYSPIGRPSVDPELMIRMLIIGYCYGIRSERRLCEEVHLNLAYRWFCRLGLEEAVPNHSTFPRTVSGASGRARRSAGSLTRWCAPAGRPVWSRAKVSPSMPASWRPKPVPSWPCLARSPMSGRIRPGAAGPFASTWRGWLMRPWPRRCPNGFL